MKHFDSIIKACRQNKLDPDLVFASTFDSMRALSRIANLNGTDVVVAVGGDGTINAVLNGFYDDTGKKISQSKFAVIYTGTSPDFCKSYDISLKHEEAIQSLVNGSVKK